MSTIHDNVNRVREQIAAACARANRSPDDITLVAVSKRKPVNDVLAAINAGVQHFGENRVEEAETKIPEVVRQLPSSADLTWHMVGHVQSRKAKAMLPLFSVFHSVDSLKLAEKLARLSAESNTDHKLGVFIQVNIAGEEQKYGFNANQWETDTATREALFQSITAIRDLDALYVRGLMTMAPYGAPEHELRAVFASLAALKVEIEQQCNTRLPDLSMGMTDDYPIAIEEGATIVRVGRAIFGEREYETR